MSALLVTLVAPLAVRLAEEGEHEPNHLLSYGIGAIALGILLFLLIGLLGFGKGREHA